MERRERRPSSTRSKLNAAHNAALLLETKPIEIDRSKKYNEEDQLVLSPNKKKSSGPISPHLLEPKGYSQRRRKSNRIICDREKALIAAYLAAARLIGAAPGDMTLTPIRYIPVKPHSVEEKALVMEQALMDRIVALGHQLKTWQTRAAKAHKTQQDKIDDLDRKLFHVKCGFELMRTLVKEARIDTCQRAIEFMRNRSVSRDSPFIRILNDDYMVHADNDPSSAQNLLTADALLQRYGRKPNLYMHELPDGQYHHHTSAHYSSSSTTNPNSSYTKDVVVGAIF
mmetsp:Transcript_16728/g.25135  ORF Transcript_16728/g.25135 Transcript_16728/m.25135 type:complete len:284 (-) Transcript_16728:42-893(-)|eukprot:CAMPEP_0197315442 /NCGR_PEP_ID=MMETSP0891-20130614/38283_1 /TAXON_ID=44058 ORGANISM="Aureoumbra lagunensis, Strain CCMP1510" /NCGR_SAMPLE_ID=MMETSP0891 /ASSEMBLY_ACC=CAM_ASM_000534 /LENGTH=283 /DNA_ID=CAMNT_0042804399 /DNA_START=67 /DNA_END=918 /DNA_ORIENTATION=+